MITPEIYRKQLMFGLYSRVAKRLGLERSHIRRVAMGERKSLKVERLLRKEIARIDAKVEQFIQRQERVA